MPLSVGPGTSVLAGHAHAATQTDTGRQLDAGATQRNSDQDKEEGQYHKKEALYIVNTGYMQILMAYLP